MMTQPFKREYLKISTPCPFSMMVDGSNLNGRSNRIAPSKAKLEKKKKDLLSKAI